MIWPGRGRIHFVGIPLIFAKHHHRALDSWFRSIEMFGPKFRVAVTDIFKASIIDAGADPLQLRPLKYATLRASFVGPRDDPLLIVRPADTESARIIAEQVEDLDKLYNPDDTFAGLGD